MGLQGREDQQNEDPRKRPRRPLPANLPTPKPSTLFTLHLAP